MQVLIKDSLSTADLFMQVFKSTNIFPYQNEIIAPLGVVFAFCSLPSGCYSRTSQTERRGLDTPKSEPFLEERGKLEKGVTKKSSLQ